MVYAVEHRRSRRCAHSRSPESGLGRRALSRERTPCPVSASADETGHRQPRTPWVRDSGDRTSMTETDNSDEVHVRLRFPDGGAALDYRTSKVIAHRLATDFARHGVTVTIDDDLAGNLTPLPNTELWTR